MTNGDNISPLFAALGQRIRVLRQEQGLSQAKLGHMVDIDRTYLIGIEHGQRNVSLSVLARLSKGLGVTLSELFEGLD